MQYLYNWKYLLVTQKGKFKEKFCYVVARFFEITFLFLASQVLTCSGVRSSVETSWLRQKKKKFILNQKTKIRIPSLVMLLRLEEQHSHRLRRQLHVHLSQQTVNFYSVLYTAMCVHAHSCPTLCDPLDCSMPGSSVHGIFQARILKWVAISSSRRSS